jgi:hypothetical protein
MPRSVNKADLRTEAIVFGRYLVGSEPAEPLVQRYIEANEMLLAGYGTPEDEAVLDFARRHPWSIAMLDAAAGVRGGASLLRRKLLVMTAIVETTPENVDKTEQRAVGLPTLVARVGVATARTAMSAGAGLVLAAVLRRRS